MKVGHRHLRRWNQVQIPVPGDLEEIRFEFRQLRRSPQRLGIDQKRRLDLDVSVLARVHIEHEIDQRPREPRAGAHQHRKAGTGHLRGAIEVQDA